MLEWISFNLRSDRVEETQIRVYKDDVGVALEYKAAIDMGFSFYEGQVDRNNRLCEQINEIGANKWVYSECLVVAAMPLRIK